MAIVINGSGTVTGISVGGLPDGIVDSGTLATNSVDSAELIDGSIDTAHIGTDQITSAILPTGSVLQVVQTVKTDSESFSTASLTWTDISDMSVAITPTASDSKVLVSFSIMAGGAGANPYPKIKLLKDGSDLVVGDVSGDRVRMTSGWGQGISTVSDCEVVSFEYLDSPATTSETTYKVQVCGFSSRTFHINITGGSDANNGMSCVSTITAKEIAG
jgi:hypothetical protein